MDVFVRAFIYLHDVVVSNIVYVVINIIVDNSNVESSSFNPILPELATLLTSMVKCYG